MACNPENVRLTVLMKLQEALDEEAILEEQRLALMHRFAHRFIDRRVEINNLIVLHDHPLIDYDKYALGCMTGADMKKCVELKGVRDELLRRHVDANVDWNRKRKRDLECEDDPEAKCCPPGGGGMRIMVTLIPYFCIKPPHFSSADLSAWSTRASCLTSLKESSKRIRRRTIAFGSASVGHTGKRGMGCLQYVDVDNMITHRELRYLRMQKTDTVVQRLYVTKHRIEEPLTYLTTTEEHAKCPTETDVAVAKDEARVNLDTEENDFMLMNAYGDNQLEELNVLMIMMARTQANDNKSNVKPAYDAKVISEETLENAIKSGLKMKDKMIQLDYVKMNKLYKSFVPQKEISIDQTYLSPPSTSNVTPKSSSPKLSLPPKKMPKES
nr:hypothetical protein [Tanacetum cinerariifolium]